MTILPSADSRRVVVSHKRKYVQKVLVNCSVKLAQEKSVVRWTNRPNMTIAVDWDVKKQTKKLSEFLISSRNLITWTRQVDGKQGGSWLAGFIRSQLIWIYVVFQRVYRISKNLSLLGWIQRHSCLKVTDSWVKVHFPNPELLKFKSLNMLYANKSVIFKHVVCQHISNNFKVNCQLSVDELKINEMLW